MAHKKSYAGEDRTMRNAAQTLLANIRFASVDDPIKTVVITSSVPNEGKTTVSVELARAMARGGRTVLLVECDMRRRSLAATLGRHPETGLYSVLSGATDYGQSSVAVEENLWFLDVEPHIPNPPEIIASKRFRRFVAEVRQRFDFVVFDTPPLAAFVDAAVLSSIVDGTVMVVRESFVKRTELVDAYAQLQNAGANVVGVCMNYCHEERSEYYYAYYDRQGRRVRTSDADLDDDETQLPPLAPSGSSHLLASTDASMPVNRTRPSARRVVESDSDAF